MYHVETNDFRKQYEKVHERSSDNVKGFLPSSCLNYLTNILHAAPFTLGSAVLTETSHDFFNDRHKPPLEWSQ